MAKKKAGIICHMCGEMGHKSFQCPKNPEVDSSIIVEEDSKSSNFQPYQFHPRPAFYPRRQEGGGVDGQHSQGPRRALEDVVCYKCGYKGHYANKCNKGHLAFLSHKAGGANREGVNSVRN
jgi:cleavage and polyadenylation specificity factor subunit 4